MHWDFQLPLTDCTGRPTHVPYTAYVLPFVGPWGVHRLLQFVLPTSAEIQVRLVFYVFLTRWDFVTTLNHRDK